MSLNIISNYAANVAQRNLVMSDRDVTTSLTKLSSGQRVVSARDDAASMAIGSRLKAEVAAMRTANVNTAQAGSMLQIADGAMATISDILIRMKELSVQASSGQFSDLERGILDSEYQALLSEISRIANDTEYNGQSLIAGSATTASQLASALVTNTKLDSNNDGFTSFTFENSVLDSAFQITFDATTNVLTAVDIESGTSQSVTIDATAIAAQAAGDNTSVSFNNLGLTIQLNTNFVDADITTTASVVNQTSGTNGALIIAAGGITLDSVNLLSTVGIADLGTAANVQVDINTGTNGTDGTVTLQVTGTGNDFTATAVDLTSTGAVTVTLTRDGLDAAGATVTDTIVLDIVVGTAANGNDEENNNTALGNFNNVVFSAQTGDSTTTSFTFKVGTGNSTFDSLTFVVNAASGSALSLTGTLISTAANAETASTAVSAAIDILNQSRADVGAAQNRLTFASNNLATAIENAEAARSNLLDLDVASEISNFTSKQILVQTGVAMLAQANQLPQNLLRLFQ